MLIPSIYLIIAGQIALIMVFLIAYLIYMLVSEENRWEAYTDKLKAKIRELQEYKDRFNVVSENLHKQMTLTKELTENAEKLEANLTEKDTKIAEQDAFIVELQKTISDLQDIIRGLEKKAQLLDESNISITELKTQLSILEDQGAELPKQIDGLNITIENLESENNTLKVELISANENIAEYQRNSDNIRNDDFNLDIVGSKKVTDSNSDLLDNIRSRYQDEMDRLKKNYNNQKNIIGDLEAALMKARNNPGETIDFDIESLDKLQRMLSESNTVVEMLEGEIDTLQAEIDQLMMQNNALTTAIANSSQTTDDKAEIGEENTVDDVFFEDTSSDEDKDDITADEVFFDVESGSDDVFFDTDETSKTEQSSTSTDDSELEQIKTQLDAANQMAMTMMMTSGDQGNIINFARNSIQYETLEDLGKGVLETVALFQVNGALQLRGEEHTPFNLSSYGKLTGQDNEKISATSTDERFSEDGPELLIHFESLSLLIKDMPLNDSDKMGRIKDNMAIALELACANLGSIESAIKIKKNQKILNQVLKNTYETIQNVEQQFNEQHEITNQVINSLTGIISNPAMTHGMDPIYKDVFTSIINDGKLKFDSIKECGVAIDEDFAEIVKRLGSKINEE